MNILAQSAQIEAGKDIITAQEGHEFKQSGLTIAFSSAVTDMAVKAKDSLGRSQQVQDSRLKALHQVKAAQEGVMATQALSKALSQNESGNASGTSNNARDFKVSVSIGSQQSRTHRQSEEVSHQASLVQAGQVNLTTTEGDIDILGSTLLGQDIQLESAGDIRLLSVQDISTYRSDIKNSAWSAGVFVGYSGGSYGFGVEGSGQLGKGYENSDTLRQVNTQVQGKTVTLRSQTDTELKGAVVKGDKILADVGQNLHIESRQDTQHYDSKYTQVGALGSYAIYGSGSHMSVNASLNQGKLSYAQVEEQSGLWAGEEGLQANVEGNTHLKGGMIASQANKEKNQFTTGTLSYENLQNHSEVSVQSISGGISTDNSQNIGHAINATMSALGNINDSDRSITYSAIGATIALTAKDSQHQDSNAFNTISRDTEHANAQVKRFDIEEMRERQEMAQVIGEIANNAIQMTLKPKLDKAEQDKQAAEQILAIDPQNTQALSQLAQANQSLAQYGQDSDIQLAIRAVTGVLQGIATGSAAQAAVGGLSPYANQLIKAATTHPQTQAVNMPANLMAHAVLGAIEAYTMGNHALAGATGAVSSELMGQLITEQLYQTTPEQLTQAQRETVSSLAQMASGLAGAAVGNSTASAITSAQVGKRAVENNQLTGYGDLWGIRYWGPGAASLVNQKYQEGATVEEINKALQDYVRGDGFDNGMKDGLQLWAVVPAAATGVGKIGVAVAPVAWESGMQLTRSLTNIQALHSIGKNYLKDAAVSIGIGSTISLASEGKYTVSNLVTDATVGVLFGRLMGNMRLEQRRALKNLGNISTKTQKVLQKESQFIVNPSLRVLDFTGGYLIGGGVSSMASYYGNENMSKNLFDFNHRTDTSKKKEVKGH